MDPQTPNPLPKLFTPETNAPPSTIMIAMLAALAVLILVAAIVQTLRHRRQQARQGALGNPDLLLSRIAPVLPLTWHDQRMLKKIAARLGLHQPLAILLAPQLLVKAAICWGQLANWKFTRNWGIRRLNDFAVELYGMDLHTLPENPQISPPPHGR